MSGEWILDVHSEVRRVPKDSTHPRALRVYPSSPASVHLQVRGVLGQKTRLFAAVDLTAAEVMRLRDYLTGVLEHHFQIDKAGHLPGCQSRSRDYALPCDCWEPEDDQVRACERLDRCYAEADAQARANAAPPVFVAMALGILGEEVEDEMGDLRRAALDHKGRP